MGVQWLDLSFNEITGIDEHLRLEFNCFLNFSHNVTILGISSCTKLLITTVQNRYICNIYIFLYPRAENALTVTDVSSALKKCGTPTVWDTLS